MAGITQEQIEYTLAQRTVPELAHIIFAAFCEIKRRHQGASARESDADKEVSRIYHAIEFGTFDAARGYAPAKELQGALRARRNAKHDKAALKDLAIWIGNSDESLRRMVRRFDSKEYWEQVDNETA